MKKYTLIIILFCYSSSWAQDSYTMKFLPQLQQSQWVDASNQTDNKVNIGLPVISAMSFYVYNSGFTFHDVFQTVNDSTKLINMGRLFGNLQPVNYVSCGLNIPIFSLMVSRLNLSLGCSINDKVDFQFSYPANMFNFLWYGNGYYINKNIDVGNFGLNAAWYREFALHAAYTYKKWAFGFSPKILVGKTNITTLQSSLVLNTSPESSFYKVTATATMKIKESGIPDSTDNADGGYFSTAAKTIDYLFDIKNIGYAMDLGAKYTINDRINVSAGVNNLGYITWKGFVHNYSVTQQVFTFEGLHLENFIQGDSNAVNTQTLKDSIKNIVKFNKDSNPYTTYLPYDLYVMGKYQLKHHWFGLELTARRFNGKFLYSGTACYQLKFGKHFTGAFTYTLKSFSPFNIGGGLVFQFLNMQYYFVTDNWYAAIIPLDSKNANISFGMNLAFGNRFRKTKANLNEATVDPPAEFQPVPNK